MAAKKKTTTPKKKSTASKTTKPRRGPVEVGKTPPKYLGGAKWKKVHEKLSDLCAELPETFEVLAWGHPNWKVGQGTKAKMFASWGAEGDLASMGVMTDPFERKVLLEDERITVAKYVGHKGWISFRMDNPNDIEWKLVARLLKTSHAIISGKRPG